MEKERGAGSSSFKRVPHVSSITTLFACDSEGSMSTIVHAQGQTSQDVQSLGGYDHARDSNAKLLILRGLKHSRAVQLPSQYGEQIARQEASREPEWSQTANAR